MDGGGWEQKKSGEGEDASGFAVTRPDRCSSLNFLPGQLLCAFLACLYGPPRAAFLLCLAGC